MVNVQNLRQSRDRADGNGLLVVLEGKVLLGSDAKAGRNVNDAQFADFAQFADSVRYLTVLFLVHIRSCFLFTLK